jgi:hypothetical protein
MHCGEMTEPQFQHTIIACKMMRFGASGMLCVYGACIEVTEFEEMSNLPVHDNMIVYMSARNLWT